MADDQKSENINPVAQLRERYFERKRNQKPLTEAERDAFRRDKAKEDESNERGDRKIARDPELDRGMDLE